MRFDSFSPTYSILSIDGGGIRGIIPCKVLMYIEEKLRGKIHVADLFDLMAGTSTGGILACGLAIKGSDGQPMFKPSELIDLYTGEEGKKIFKVPKIGGTLNTIRNIFQRKFKGSNIEEVLREKFGEARLSEAYTDLLITAYETEQKLPFFFKSSDARRDPQFEDFRIWEVARATSAAPTYFPIKKIGDYRKQLTKWASYPPPNDEELDREIENLHAELAAAQSNGQNRAIIEKELQRKEKLRRFGKYNEKLNHLSLVDGGLFANNPSLAAYIEAMKAWKEDHKYLSLLKEYQQLRRQQAIAAAQEAIEKAMREAGRAAGGDGLSSKAASAAAKAMVTTSAGKGFFSSVESDDSSLPFLMLSIGTGQSRRPYSYKKAKNWGIAKWAQPAVDIMMQGVSEYIDEHMRHLLPPYEDPAKTPRYIRINIELDPDHSAMDDASTENTTRLRDEYGEMIIENNKEVLDRTINLLVQIYKKRQSRKQV